MLSPLAGKAEPIEGCGVLVVRWEKRKALGIALDRLDEESELHSS
jgi:hypothetical protein